MASPTLPAPVPVFAVRDFGFTVSSPIIPLVEFESRLQFAEDLEAVVNARLDYNLGTAVGSYPFTDLPIAFDPDHVATITTNGLVQTIRLQNYLGDSLSLQRPSDGFIEWAGPIVATRVIPEPATTLLAIAALFAIIAACQRKPASASTTIL
jgi:hypothetical protein